MGYTQGFSTAAQAKLVCLAAGNTVGASTSAYLTCGTAGSSTAATWAALTNTGKFTITINGTAITDCNPDFTGAATMADVATAIQTALRLGLALTTCVWSTDHFVITSPTVGAGSTITVLTAPGAGIDLAAAAWMNGKVGAGTITASTTGWNSLLHTGKFSVYVDETKLTDLNPDFTACTTMATVATAIQTALNAALTGTTCTWNTDHFEIISPTYGERSSVDQLLAPSAGTDIAGASWMNGKQGYQTIQDMERDVLAKMEELIGTPLNTGGTATLGAILGDFVGSALVTRIINMQADIGAGADGSTLGSLYLIMGNPTSAISTVLGTNITLAIGGGSAAANQDVQHMVRWAIDNLALNSQSTTINTNTDPKVMGRTQIFEKTITSAANAGDVTVGTITTQACFIKSITVAATGAQTANLTNIGVYGGTSKVVTFIDTVTGLRANIAATDQQVFWYGAARIPATGTIVITLTGTGGAATALQVTVEYEACVSGGYIA